MNRFLIPPTDCYGRELLAVMVFMLVGWGVIAFDPGTYRGMRHHNDSRSYLYAAESYAEGRGMRYLDASWKRDHDLFPLEGIMTAWSPGYPVLLMLYQRVGINVNAGALVANLLAFGAVGACAVRATRRYQIGWMLTLCVLGTLLFNPGYHTAIQYLGSDMVFVGVCAIFLETLDSYLS